VFGKQLLGRIEHLVERFRPLFSLAAWLAFQIQSPAASA
jgi:hypothetical protein